MIMRNQFFLKLNRKYITTENAIKAVAPNVNEEPNCDQIKPAIILASKLQILWQDV